MRNAFMDAGDLAKYHVTPQEIERNFSPHGTRGLLPQAAALKLRPWLLDHELPERDLEVIQVHNRDEYEIRPQCRALLTVARADTHPLTRCRSL